MSLSSSNSACVWEYIHELISHTHTRGRAHTHAHAHARFTSMIEALISLFVTLWLHLVVIFCQHMFQSGYPELTFTFTLHSDVKFCLSVLCISLFYLTICFLTLSLIAVLLYLPRCTCLILVAFNRSIIIEIYLLNRWVCVQCAGLAQWLLPTSKFQFCTPRGEEFDHGHCPAFWVPTSCFGLSCWTKFKMT